LAVDAKGCSRQQSFGSILGYDTAIVHGAS